MRLRTQILLVLLLFALTPLIAAVLFNRPLVLDRVEQLYHQAHLLNLRADFSDLDQHLASRHEMVRLLSKLPEPGSLLGDDESTDYLQIDLARARYTQWLNQILRDQLDIIQILFLDTEGRERFWLERDRSTLEWTPTTRKPIGPGAEFLAAGKNLEQGRVLVTPISVDPVAALTDPRRLMSLHMISAITGAAEKQPDAAMGSVVMTIDVGGIANAYRDTLWVSEDGNYLRYNGVEQEREAGQAFADFPGLEQIFRAGKLALWKGDGRQVIWVPMLITENGGFLWVGRSVDPSPLAAFRNAVTVRTLAIIVALIVAVLLVARWFALRIERTGRELTEGVRRMLQNDDSVVFSWGSPRELRELGEGLTRLGESHARHNRALRQHARELEQSNRYKSEFLANVSHELRTPLNSILLLSKMLSERRDGLTVDQMRQAQVIYDAGKDLRSLIDNILDISRIEAGQAVLHPEAIDLPALIGDLMELVSPQFADKGLSLRLVVGEDAQQRIVSDSEKLRQILKNFLSNAVKFTQHGGCVIEVLRNTGADADRLPVRISVTDTGIGIAGSKQDVIFEAFKQADGSTSRRFGGTGLGLTISRELAGLMGGRIELRSEEGSGATFSLMLPLECTESDGVSPRVADQQTTPGDVESPQSPVPEASFQNRCVLIVANDVRQLLTLTPLLEGWGVSVTAAGDGAEATDTLNDEGECSLVLLDMMMPERDGYNILARIREQRGSQPLPVIALVESGNEGLVAECLRAGANEVLEIPVQPAALKQTLERFFS